MAPRIKVHETETPSESIVRAANQTYTVTDTRGRSIGIRKLGALARMKMLEAIGPENCRNEVYMGYAALAFCVATIDGDPVPAPTNKLQLEALVQRLDDEGLNAVAEGMTKHFAPQDE